MASFFTIQSNVLAAVTSAQLARDPHRDGPIWRVVRLDARVGIIVTGVVYSTVLARIHQPNGWQEWSTNTVVHYVVPIMMVLGWLLFGRRSRITGRVVAWSLVFPILWFGYTLIRGERTPWYPYPFVDVVSHGYPTVLVNALLVTIVLGAVSALFWWGDRELPPAPAGERAGAAAQADSARTTFDGLGRPSFAAIHRLVSTSVGRSMPVWMPRPCSIHTRSSVARLPVAFFAYGQPPSPPAEASTVVIPACKAANVLASAWP